MDLLNPALLWGLAGLAVPVIIHLLSRRRQDVVDWGAMQFLEPSPREQRSLWIENLLLMLLRMGLLAALALAFARPWLQSSWLASLTTSRPQDVAIIVDGSVSLERVSGQRTVTDLVRRMARDVIDELDAADNVQVYDAREMVRARLPGYVPDRTAAREAILDLPVPTGASSIVEALTIATRDLLKATQLHRDIVVITDGQKFAWRTEDVQAWGQLQRLWQAARIKPRVHVLTPPPIEGELHNLTLGSLELSRELIRPGANVLVKCNFVTTGLERTPEAIARMEIDGVVASDQQTVVRLPPEGTGVIEREVTLTAPGSHAIRLWLDVSDDLPADNAVEGVIEVGRGPSLLLVEGSPKAPPEERETFFLQAALGHDAGGWMKPTVIDAASFATTELTGYDVVVLAPLPAFSNEDWSRVEEYLQAGGTVVASLGDQPRPENVPVKLLALKEPEGEQTVTIDADSLERSWQAPFRRQRQAGLCAVPFLRWWTVDLAPAVPATPPRPDVTATATTTGDWEALARLTTGDPVLLRQKHGQGWLAIWTSTFNASGNRLPSQPDYVAWWNEALLSLMQATVRRNVRVGEGLLTLSPPGPQELTGDYHGPLGFKSPGAVWKAGRRTGRTLAQPPYPGLYAFTSRERWTAAGGQPARALGAGSIEGYAVSADARESDLTPLSANDRQALGADGVIQFLESPAELRQQWLADAGRSELVIPLLYLFIAMLVMESWLTRRRVRGQGRA